MYWLVLLSWGLWDNALVMFSFSDISGVRLKGALGATLGRARRAGSVSDVDGDGDGFVTGPDGEDNVPAPVAAVDEVWERVGPEGVKMQGASPVPELAKKVKGDFTGVMAVEPEKRGRIARHYDAQPLVDEAAKKAYDDLAREIDDQFEMLKDMGIKVEFVDYDPYEDFHALREDFVKNRRMRVLKTSVTGSHSYWSDETNDKFRAVHDAFGHLATGRGFDRHGEEAAYQAHKSMLPASVHGALAMETRAQNSFLIERGEFPPQKVGVLPDELLKRLRDVVARDGRATVSADDDNLYKVGRSHHVTGGRFFRDEKKSLIIHGVNQLFTK